MLAFKLAYKNLLGAGLRTFLIVLVLSFSFVIIIFYNGMMDGWNDQARRDSVAWQFGEGQIWNEHYDPYDPYTLVDAHAPLPPALLTQADQKKLVPILISQATLYPQNRMQNIILKGIPADQTILKLPTAALQNSTAENPVLIGRRMAENCKLKKGDNVLLRWRDKNGTFDALEVNVAEVFSNDVPGVDNGQVWIALDRMQKMTGMQGEATLLVTSDQYQPVNDPGWSFKSLDFLLADIAAIIQSKKGSMGIIYILLLGMALLAIFDTQVLSIFRRQKEIGTYIALGMTRSQVVRLFTVEGGFHSILAAIFAAIYGIPLLSYLAKNGIPMPYDSSDMGITISNRIFPVYGLALVLGTVLLVVISTTVVSYLPARRISKLKPTDALKGKLQ